MNEFQYSNTFFLIVSAVYWASRYLDMVSSKGFLNYGLKEGRAFSYFDRNKDGSFNVKGSIVISAIWWGASLGIELGLRQIGEGGGWGLLLVGVLGSVLMAFKNFKDKKKYRALQISVLRSIRSGVMPNLGWLVYSGATGRTYYQLFPLVYSMTKNDEQDVKGKLVELAGKSESEWFAEDTW
jgi:hypothetical protein